MLPAVVVALDTVENRSKHSHREGNKIGIWLPSESSLVDAQMEQFPPRDGPKSLYNHLYNVLAGNFFYSLPAIAPSSRKNPRRSFFFVLPMMDNRKSLTIFLASTLDVWSHFLSVHFHRYRARPGVTSTSRAPRAVRQSPSTRSLSRVEPKAHATVTMAGDITFAKISISRGAQRIFFVTAAGPLFTTDSDLSREQDINSIFWRVEKPGSKSVIDTIVPTTGA
ncbi:hypothetical protein EDD18DRAFT_1109607 [Armillaria luteobubalina]|uniref:Uncharacterized protein n=1 Tax=Armillaria luteobubalina TaxID=153913 RepID=A0AA39PWI4_9AGAR|nr:hypothetical protein EDD18DRAFT_1109607 [Armillaria luteobubalina]